jgi:hypothetical protein
MKFCLFPSLWLDVKDWRIISVVFSYLLDELCGCSRSKSSYVTNHHY